jgi:predicted metal-binding membrane protein
MMTAMMVPTAAPMILVFASLNRRRHDPQPLLTSTGVFLLGYLVVWSGFAALATVAQWGLHIGALLSPMMVSISPILGGALLLAAGVFQLSPIKYACLSNCRTPIGFLMTEWRDGPRGALVMGLRHGLYCLGCCWALMSLLFVLGVMNLLWIAALAGFVLVEKVTPRGHLVSRLSGLVLIGWSGWVFLVRLG